jgi:hypothetical protein
MIDQNLIDENIITLTNALKNNTSVTDQIKIVKNAFNQSLMSKLQEYFDENYNSNLWRPESTRRDQVGDRFNISWDPESVIEELNEVCQKITPVVSEIFSDGQKKFKGLVIWRDHPGYYFGWHQDGPDIEVSLQFYLSGSARNPGTEYNIHGNIVVLPFAPNTGYFVNHGVGEQHWHKIVCPVPEGEIRYSLFALWDNIR